MRALLAFAAAVMVAASSPAAADPRSLNVPSDKGWQHAETGLVLMAKLGDFQRESLEDYGQAELDVVATYRTTDQRSIASIYLFRPGLPDVAVWFDRAQLAMSLSKDIALGAPIGPAGQFALPGASSPGGLKIVHALNGKPTGSTGLAIAPIGDWLVKIRLSSDTMDGTALDAALTDLIGKIRWPANVGGERIASPVQPCASALKFKKAKVLKPDLAQALLGAALNMAVIDSEDAQSEPEAAPTYCREGTGSANYAVYRAVGSNNGFVLALGDAGIAARVFPEFSLDGRKGNFSVVLEDLDSSDSYPGFNALPQPAQVFEMVTRMSPVSSASRGGKDITISPVAK